MISGAISFKNFLAAQRLHRQAIAKRVVTFFVFLIFVGVAVILTDQATLGLVVVGGAIGGLLGELFQSKFLLPRKSAKLYKQQAALKSTFTYSWDQEHLCAASATGSSKRPWVDYVQSKENEQLFLLYHSDCLFEMLPKSWFPNPELIAEFRRLAPNNSFKPKPLRGSA